MSSREFEIERGEILRIEAAPGDRLQVRLGDVWVTQHHDSKDYMLRAGGSMNLSGEGVTLAMAYKRSLLVWYRSDPRPGSRSRPLGTFAWLRKVFA